MEQKPVHERLHIAQQCPSDSFDRPPVEAWRAFDLAMGAYIRGGMHGMWLPPETEDGHVDPNELAFRIAERHAELVGLFNGDEIKSPIEAQLVAALLWIEADWAGFPSYKPFDAAKGRDPSDGVAVFLAPQARIRDFRVDFVLWAECGHAWGGIVIECDGHAFHERTKEQAARDKKRDRDLLALGYPVARFTGSEIFTDPVACAEQVNNLFFRVMERVTKEGQLI